MGMDRKLSLLLGGFNGLEYLVASLVQIYTINHFGRRTLLLFASTGQTLCMLILAITVHDGGYGASIVAATMLFLFNTVYSFGYLTVSRRSTRIILLVHTADMCTQMPYLYPAELVLFFSYFPPSNPELIEISFFHLSQDHNPSYSVEGGCACVCLGEFRTRRALNDIFIFAN